MDATAILIVYVISFMLWLIILKFVINSATRSNEQVKLLKTQVKLLSKMLELDGVSSEEINRITK